jgi:hypothetical protein
MEEWPAIDKEEKRKRRRKKEKERLGTSRGGSAKRRGGCQRVSRFLKSGYNLLPPR